MEKAREEHSRETSDDADVLEEQLDAEHSPNDSIRDQALQAEEMETADIEALVQELEHARAQANEYLDGWQRARAEFANYKKRVDRDQAQVYQVTAGNILKQYLVVMDDLELALKNRPSDGQGGEWANVIELIYRKFASILENEGVEPMDVEGHLFDPNQHEALSSEADDQHESGEIIEVVKKGYLIGDRILRPALVRVAQ